MSVAQGRGPPDVMKEVESALQRSRVPVVKISDSPEGWDLQALVAIFHDFHDSLFCDDFIPQVKAKSLLLGIKDIRNKRAHDNPMTAREVYRLADLTEQFFEATQFKQVVGPFDSVRLEALELLVSEE